MGYRQRWYNWSNHHVETKDLKATGTCRLGLVHARSPLEKKNIKESLGGVEAIMEKTWMKAIENHATNVDVPLA